MNTIKIGIILDHKEALAIYTASGHDYPTIPDGCNTLEKSFRTPDGKHALLVNQRGFSPIASDNEEEVNGCLVFICTEDCEEALAFHAIEQALNTIRNHSSESP